MCDIFLQPLASHRPVAFLLIGITPETLPCRDLLLKLAPTSEVPVYCSLTPFLRSRQGQYTVAHTPKPCPLHWSGRRDSNPRPRPWQGRALPTELLPRGGIFGLSPLLRRGKHLKPLSRIPYGSDPMERSLRMSSQQSRPLASRTM